MDLTKEDISNLVQYTDKVEAFDSIMKRNIPYEPYQLAMMFMSGRRIGKSFMSYGLVAEECHKRLQEFGYVTVCHNFDKVRGETPKSIIVARYYDRDVEGHQRFEGWMNKFQDFIKEYYPELRVDRKSSYYTVRKVERPN